jgi:hypothetical protein
VHDRHDRILGGSGEDDNEWKGNSGTFVRNLV